MMGIFETFFAITSRVFNDFVVMVIIEVSGIQLKPFSRFVIFQTDIC